PPPPPPPLVGEGVLGGLAPRDAQGRTTGSSVFTSTDGRVSFDIPAGTIARDSSGNNLTGISVTSFTNPPAPPTGSNIVGLPYEIGPTGATFTPPITMTFTYDPATVPAGATLVLAYYNPATGLWVELPATVDTVSHTFTVTIDHFTLFAVLAKLPPPAAPPPPVIPPPPPGPNWTLIGSIIAALLILAIVIYWRRRRQRRQNSAV
ncbi:MAG: hypothetical protein Q8P00_00525, partial [Dehalococcoidia bacterium]|nr:hypothetical protein [Dehalococcoidia bacterium]